MFNAICGDFLTDSGSIVLDGEDITFLPQHARAKNIGRLYQDPMRGTAPGMTILENLALLQVVEAGFPVFPKVINSVFVNSLHFWILALKTA